MGAHPLVRTVSLVVDPKFQNYVASIGYEESPISSGLTTSQESPISLGVTPLVLRDSTSMDPHSKCYTRGTVLTPFQMGLQVEPLQ